MSECAWKDSLRLLTRINTVPLLKVLVTKVQVSKWRCKPLSDGCADSVLSYVEGTQQPRAMTGGLMKACPQST